MIQTTRKAPDARSRHALLTGFGAIFFSVLLAACAQTSPAPGKQGAAPGPGTGTGPAAGTTSKTLGAIDLGNEMEGMTGRQLRARTVTIEPGGQVAAHEHKGRPTVEYVVQGEVVEIRNGVEIPHKAGETVFADKSFNHRWENRGAATVILMPVDIFTP
jgi:quercetin dioxygenase-like cupin family protein